MVQIDLTKTDMATCLYLLQQECYTKELEQTKRKIQLKGIIKKFEKAYVDNKFVNEQITIN
jgi:hypothetical protein